MTDPVLPAVPVSSPANGPSLAEIKKARDDANERLSDYEDTLLTRFSELRDKIRKGGGWDKLPAAEKDEYNALSAAIDEVQHAIVMLAMITLQSINQSHEVRDIVSSLKGIAKDLRNTAEKLNKIEKAVETAAQIAKLVVAVAQKLGPLAVGA